MKIAFDLSKYEPAVVRELLVVVNSNWVEGFKFLFILDDLTKHDLKELLGNLSDDVFHDLFKDVKKDLHSLLEMNEGRADHHQVEWVDTRGQTRLDEFIYAKG